MKKHNSMQQSGNSSNAVNSNNNHNFDTPNQQQSSQMNLSKNSQTSKAAAASNSNLWDINDKGEDWGKVQQNKQTMPTGTRIANLRTVTTQSNTTNSPSTRQQQKAKTPTYTKESSSTLAGQNNKLLGESPSSNQNPAGPSSGKDQNQTQRYSRFTAHLQPVTRPSLSPVALVINKQAASSNLPQSNPNRHQHNQNNANEGGSGSDGGEDGLNFEKQESTHSWSSGPKRVLQWQQSSVIPKKQRQAMQKLGKRGPDAIKRAMFEQYTPIGQRFQSSNQGGATTSNKATSENDFFASTAQVTAASQQPKNFFNETQTQGTSAKQHTITHHQGPKSHHTADNLSINNNKSSTAQIYRASQSKSPNQPISRIQGHPRNTMSNQRGLGGKSQQQVGGNPRSTLVGGSHTPTLPPNSSSKVGGSLKWPDQHQDQTITPTSSSSQQAQQQAQEKDSAINNNNNQNHPPQRKVQQTHQRPPQVPPLVKSQSVSVAKSSTTNKKGETFYSETYDMVTSPGNVAVKQVSNKKNEGAYTNKANLNTTTSSSLLSGHEKAQNSYKNVQNLTKQAKVHGNNQKLSSSVTTSNTLPNPPVKVVIQQQKSNKNTNQSSSSICQQPKSQPVTTSLENPELQQHQQQVQQQTEGSIGQGGEQLQGQYDADGYFVYPDGSYVDPQGYFYQCRKVPSSAIVTNPPQVLLQTQHSAPFDYASSKVTNDDQQSILGERGEVDSHKNNQQIVQKPKKQASVSHVGQKSAKNSFFQEVSTQKQYQNAGPARESNFNTWAAQSSSIRQQEDGPGEQEDKLELESESAKVTPVSSFAKLVKKSSVVKEVKILSDEGEYGIEEISDTLSSSVNLDMSFAAKPQTSAPKISPPQNPPTQTHTQPQHSHTFKSDNMNVKGVKKVCLDSPERQPNLVESTKLASKQSSSSFLDKKSQNNNNTWQTIEESEQHQNNRQAAKREIQEIEGDSATPLQPQQPDKVKSVQNSSIGKVSAANNQQSRIISVTSTNNQQSDSNKWTANDNCASQRETQLEQTAGLSLKGQADAAAEKPPQNEDQFEIKIATPSSNTKDSDSWANNVQSVKKASLDSESSQNLDTWGDVRRPARQTNSDFSNNFASNHNLHERQGGAGSKQEGRGLNNNRGTNSFRGGYQRGGLGGFSSRGGTGDFHGRDGFTDSAEFGGSEIRGRGSHFRARAAGASFTNSNQSWRGAGRGAPASASSTSFGGNSVSSRGGGLLNQANLSKNTDNVWGEELKEQFHQNESQQIGSIAHNKPTTSKNEWTTEEDYDSKADTVGLGGADLQGSSQEEQLPLKSTLSSPPKIVSLATKNSQMKPEDNKKSKEKFASDKGCKNLTSNPNMAADNTTSEQEQEEDQWQLTAPKSQQKPTIQIQTPKIIDQINTDGQNKAETIDKQLSTNLTQNSSQKNEEDIVPQVKNVDTSVSSKIVVDPADLSETYQQDPSNFDKLIEQQKKYLEALMQAKTLAQQQKAITEAQAQVDEYTSKQELNNQHFQAQSNTLSQNATKFVSKATQEETSNQQQPQKQIDSKDVDDEKILPENKPAAKEPKSASKIISDEKSGTETTAIVNLNQSSSSVSTPQPSLKHQKSANSSVTNGEKGGKQSVENEKEEEVDIEGRVGGHPGDTTLEAEQILAQFREQIRSAQQIMTDSEDPLSQNLVQNEVAVAAAAMVAAAVHTSQEMDMGMGIGMDGMDMGAVLGGAEGSQQSEILMGQLAGPADILGGIVSPGGSIQGGGGVFNNQFAQHQGQMIQPQSRGSPSQIHTPQAQMLPDHQQNQLMQTHPSATTDYYQRQDLFQRRLQEKLRLEQQLQKEEKLRKENPFQQRTSQSSRPFFPGGPPRHSNNSPSPNSFM